MSKHGIQKMSRMALLLAMGCPFLIHGAPVGSLRKGKDHRIEVRSNGPVEHRIEFNLDKYSIDNVEEDGKMYSRLICQGGVLHNRKGYAELPFFHAALQLDKAEKYRIVVEDEVYEDIVLQHPILPSKGVIYRNENPRLIARNIAPESLKGDWFPKRSAEVADPFIFRDVRGVNVYLNPFRYHAATKTLRVVTRMVVRLEPTGEVLDEEFSAPRKRVAEMDTICQSLFANASEASVDRWSHEVGEKGGILVIHTPRDASAIQPYVQWKRERGYKVKVVEVPTGTNVKNLIKQEYLNDPGLLYVQLVGDWSDIKSDLGTSQYKPMDPVLGCVAGNDAYPELIIGRFSANSASQVTAQVNKTINYEKNADPSSDWFKRGLVIASSEGPGDDGESDIQHEKNIRDYRLLRTSYKSVTSALGDGTSKSIVRDAVNNGLNVINYTGHGWENGWGTTGFNSGDASALTNGGRLPIVCSVACLVGSFQGDCFAEAWLRNPNGGAVAGLFSSISQPWSPPMRGQDYFNDMLTGGMTIPSILGTVSAPILAVEPSVPWS